MKLISLWEPWATLMAIGAKRIETRSWRTNYRGLIAIHASKGGMSKSNLAATLAAPEFALALKGHELSPGHIVAVANLIDCCPTDDLVCLPGVFNHYPELDTRQERAFGDYSDGRWAWITDGLHRLPSPIPFKSRQGMFEPEESVQRAIYQQWSAATEGFLKGAA